MPGFTSDSLRYLLLFCALPLILVPVAFLGQKIITWQVRHQNNLASPTKRGLSYWHIAVDVVLLVLIVVSFSQLISQTAFKPNFWLLICSLAIPILVALFRILELYVIDKHTESQKSGSESMARKGAKQDLSELAAFARSLLIKSNDRLEVIARFREVTHWDLPEVDAFVRQVEASYVDEQPMEAVTVESGPRHTPPAILVAVGLWVILLFAASGMSFFMRGIAGILGTAASAFSIALLVRAARRTRPSCLWLAVEIGLFVGLVASVLIVRIISLQPGHYWNQWATFIALPIAAVCGSEVAASKWVAAVINGM
jgi:hypothetical protein